MILKVRKQKTPNQDSQKEKKKNEESEDSLESLWDYFKCTSMCIMGVQKGGEREQEIENLFEKIMTENFPNLVRKIDI